MRVLRPAPSRHEKGATQFAGRLLLELAPVVALAWWPWLLLGAALAQCYGATMDRLRRLAEAATRVPCYLFDWHYDEPVVFARDRTYVLARCSRCGRDMALVGLEARAWIEEWLRRG